MALKLFTVLTSSNPTQLTSTNCAVNSVTFYGFSGFISGMGQANPATIHIGLESGKLPIQVGGGSGVTFTLADKTPEDIANFWVKGTSGHAVYVLAS